MRKIMVQKDSGSISGFAFCIETVLIVGFLMLIGVGYSNAARTKFNVENAQVEASFAGFRSTESYYVNEGELVFDNVVFDRSYKSFLYHLKRNLNLRSQEDDLPKLIPQNGSYIPYEDTQGNQLYGKVLEYIVYVVNSDNVNAPGKIECYKSSTTGVTRESSAGRNITYAGETILKKADLNGTRNDNCLILCTKVEYPQTNLLSFNGASSTTYLTKTCAVRWKSHHIKV